MYSFSQMTLVFANTNFFSSKSNSSLLLLLLLQIFMTLNIHFIAKKMETPADVILEIAHGRKRTQPRLRSGHEIKEIVAMCDGFTARKNLRFGHPPDNWMNRDSDSQVCFWNLEVDGFS